MYLDDRFRSSGTRMLLAGSVGTRLRLERGAQAEGDGCPGGFAGSLAVVGRKTRGFAGSLVPSPSSVESRVAGKTCYRNLW
ncbi:unnamed protein product [Linum trigynum]|uniref:Uncharacterized protein n=1 Tax=Linum trigynum TaxID=586398 RepID=A0AAV2CXT3_9ROSI